MQGVSAFSHADLDALIRSGKGDIPLVQLKWQCANCRSGLTDFVVTGSHWGPASRAGTISGGR